MHSIAVIAFAAVAAASSWSGQPIPACGWTTTLIYESDHTDTVPIPIASADCSSMSTVTIPSPMPVVTTTSAPPMTTPASMPPAPPAPSSIMQCTEYSDGQPQCSMVPVVACTEYSDGQPQCGSAMPPPPPPAPTGVFPTGAYPTGAYPTGVYPTGYSSGGYAMPTGTGAIPYAPTSIVPAIGAAPTNGPIVGLLAAAGFAFALL